MEPTAAIKENINTVFLGPILSASIPEGICIMKYA